MQKRPLIFYFLYTAYKDFFCYYVLQVWKSDLLGYVCQLHSQTCPLFLFFLVVLILLRSCDFGVGLFPTIKNKFKRWSFFNDDDFRIEQCRCPRRKIKFGRPFHLFIFISLLTIRSWRSTGLLTNNKLTSLLRFGQLFAIWGQGARPVHFPE